MKNRKRITSREVYSSHKEDSKQALTEKQKAAIIAEYLSQQSKPAKPVVMNSSKPVVKADKPAPAKPVKKPSTKLFFVDYSFNEDGSLKSVALFGDTKPIKEKLADLKGSFCYRLKLGGKEAADDSEKQPGWVFSTIRLDQVKALVESVNAAL